tara:strand:+ start:132 stop:545 length:414 start_codon:yes stop_codon:yes gene_type:complete
MIVFNLKCENDHEFEIWFIDSKEYKNQLRKKIIFCPNCNSSAVSKSLMTPNLSKKSNAKSLSGKKAVINKIKKYKKIVEENFDYVGDNFTEEAKKIKYGEIKDRPIYGEANLDQTKELIEEEISFTPLPWTPNKKTN